MIENVFLVLSVRGSTAWLQVLCHHRDVKVKQLGARVQTLVAHYEGPEELSSRLLDPLGAILRELLKNFKQGPILNVIWSQLTNFRQDLNCLAPYTPDMIYTEFLKDRKEYALEDFTRYNFGDINNPSDSLLSNFISWVVLKRDNLIDQIVLTDLLAKVSS